jgi:hypothetical protein
VLKGQVEVDRYGNKDEILKNQHGQMILTMLVQAASAIIPQQG